MSGIFACIDPTGRSDCGATSLGMLGASTAAAPDGKRNWASRHAGLGFAALHVTAEARLANQPLASADGDVAVVLDGYFANHAELHVELEAKGHPPRTRADAELLLCAYRCWGEECVERLEGEFAFVLWDERRRRTLCARDHMALRPLFFHWDGARLLAASDLSALLAGMQYQPRVNRGFLAEVMTFEVCTPGETAWAGVERIQPAHVLLLENGALSQRRYWSIEDAPQIRRRKARQYVDDYLDLLSGCVERAARSDMPLAAECSGGLDSSAVFALAARLEEEDRLEAPSVHGFTFAALPGSKDDDLRHAVATAREAGRSLRIVDLFTPTLEWFRERGTADRDLPPYPNSVMFAALGQSVVNAGCRAVLNGQGGDHFLDGNRFYYREMLLRGQALRLIRTLLGDARSIGIAETAASFFKGGIAPFVPARIVNAAKREIDRDRHGEIAERIAAYHWLEAALRHELAERVAAARPAVRHHARYKHGKVSHPLTTLIQDQISRQNARIGYEARTPMMSRRFIEFYAGTPEWVRRRGSTTKWIHREAMRGILPESVVERRSKAGFGSVFDRHDEAIRKRLAAIYAESAADPDLFSRSSPAEIDGAPNWTVWGTYAACEFYLDAQAVKGTGE